jgi:hypothetical protein
LLRQQTWAFALRKSMVRMSRVTQLYCTCIITRKCTRTHREMFVHSSERSASIGEPLRTATGENMEPHLLLRCWSFGWC